MSNPNPLKILFLTRHFQNPYAAAAIRSQNLVDALLENNCRLAVATVANTPSAQQPSENCSVYCVDEFGQLPPEVHPAQVAHWPRSLTLPGPTPDTVASQALFSLTSYLLQQRLFDAICVSAPPFGLCAVAYQLAATFGKPLIIDLREPWYTHMPWPYKNRRSAQAAAQWEFQCVQHAAAIITSTETHRKLLLETFGNTLSSKIITVRHGFSQATDQEQSEKLTGVPIINRNRFNLAYIDQPTNIRAAQPGSLTNIAKTIAKPIMRLVTGTTFADQLQLGWMSPNYLIQAIAEIAAVNREFRRHCLLNFIGTIHPEIDHLAWKWNVVDNVMQHGPLLPPQARQFAQDIDMLVLTLYGIQGCDYHWSVPTTLYRYLAAQKPILGLLPPGEAADILKESGLGFVAPPDNPQAIADTLAQLFHQHQNQGVKITPNQNFIDQFNTKIHKKNFAEFILNLLNP